MHRQCNGLPKDSRMSTQLNTVGSSPAHQNIVAAALREEDVNPVLEAARFEAQQQHLPFAGSLTPQEAWQLVSQGQAILVDVRTAEERKFVGYVPDSLHVAWMTGTALNRNPRFVGEFSTKVRDKHAVVLLLCRSGKRSAAAAEALTKAGYRNVFNVLEGFEGEIDPKQQRGKLGGWRIHDLPWVQD